jgi:hypothetical protein
MEPRGRVHAPRHAGVIDSATLFLCRQGPRWVVVIESPSVTGAVAFHHTGSDADDARFELLSSAHRACPDAAVVSTDGALESADYEWRLEVLGVEAVAGQIGRALHRELAAESPPAGPAPQRTWGRRCPWGPNSIFSGRPRRF